MASMAELIADIKAKRLERVAAPVSTKIDFDVMRAPRNKHRLQQSESTKPVSLLREDKGYNNTSYKAADRNIYASKISSSSSAPRVKDMFEEITGLAKASMMVQSWLNVEPAESPQPLDVSVRRKTASNAHHKSTQRGAEEPSHTSGALTIGRAGRPIDVGTSTISEVQDSSIDGSQTKGRLELSSLCQTANQPGAMQASHIISKENDNELCKLSALHKVVSVGTFGLYIAIDDADDECQQRFFWLENSVAAGTGVQTNALCWSDPSHTALMGAVDLSTIQSVDSMFIGDLQSHCLVIAFADVVVCMGFPTATVASIWEAVLKGFCQ